MIFHSYVKLPEGKSVVSHVETRCEIYVFMSLRIGDSKIKCDERNDMK